MPWQVAASVGSSLLGGIFGDRASDRAEDIARETARMQVDESRRQYNRTRADFTPYREFGYDALADLSDPEAFQADPGYEFLRNEMLRGVINSASVRGGGGRVINEMMTRAGGLADQSYNQWYNRKLQGANIGMGAAGTVANAGENMVGRINSAVGNQGAIMQGANQQRYGSFANAAQGAISNVLYADRMGYFDKDDKVKASKPGRGNGGGW